MESRSEKVVRAGASRRTRQCSWSPLFGLHWEANLRLYFLPRRRQRIRRKCGSAFLSYIIKDRLSRQLNSCFCASRNRRDLKVQVLRFLD